MGRTGLILCAFGVLTATAAVEGVRSNRWGPAADLGEAAARLDRLPRTAGEWDGTDAPLDPKVLARSEAVAAVSRIYRHRRTGDEVGVLVLCGPPGPLAAHTPDACYAGLGYELLADPVRLAIDRPAGPPATAWAGRFGRNPPDGRPTAELEVLWAWGENGSWVATEAPRREFLLQSALYKLYVSRMVRSAPGSQRKSFDTCGIFLREFLPGLNEVLAVAGA